MVGVAGSAVRAEREQRVGLHVGDEASNHVDGILVGHLGAAAIAVPQPVVFGDTELGQARRHLGLPDSDPRIDRPSVVVREAGLSRGRRDAHDPPPSIDGERHQAGRQICLVVGVAPHAEDAADIADRVGINGRLPSPAIPLRAPHRERAAGTPRVA